MQDDRRQSLRVPLSVPLIVSDPQLHGFSEYCETVMANGHGCQLRSPRPLETGMHVCLGTVYVKNRAARATVIHSEPVELQETRAWNCGLELNTPGNFWGILSPPQDWPAADYSGKHVIASSSPAQSERCREPVHAGLPHGLTRPPQDWQQMLSAIDERIADLEARVEKATAELETGALTRLQQSFAEGIRQAGERIDRDVAAFQESHLVGLEAELEQRSARILNRSQAAIYEMAQRLESLRQEHEAWESRMAQRRHQEEVHRPDAADLQHQRLSESFRR
jgi:hypothetical protein